MMYVLDRDIHIILTPVVHTFQKLDGTVDILRQGRYKKRPKWNL